MFDCLVLAHGQAHVHQRLIQTQTGVVIRVLVEKLFEAPIGKIAQEGIDGRGVRRPPVLPLNPPAVALLGQSHGAFGVFQVQRLRFELLEAEDHAAAQIVELLVEAAGNVAGDQEHLVLPLQGRVGGFAVGTVLAETNLVYLAVLGLDRNRDLRRIEAELRKIAGVLLHHPFAADFGSRIRQPVELVRVRIQRAGSGDPPALIAVAGCGNMLVRRDQIQLRDIGARHFPDHVFFLFGLGALFGSLELIEVEESPQAGTEDQENQGPFETHTIFSGESKQ